MISFNGKSKSIEEILEDENVKKGLKDAEHVVQYINKKYISLNKADHAKYAQHLKKVLSTLVQHMRKNNELFNKLYEKEHFAGSYPDGLKIGKPTEYDMNLIIKLPKLAKPQIEPGAPSFVKIKVTEALGNGTSSLPPEFRRWIDEEGFLLQTKFREWMESVLNKVFQTFPLDDRNTRLMKDEVTNSGEVYKIKLKKSGPAMTLNITAPGEDECMLDVDLVPAFQFGHSEWPPSPVEALPESCKKKSWMVIPKPKKPKEGDTLDVNDAREWRMSFLDQERELLEGTDTVKPTIKLLKKLRDSSQIKLSSYAIKTVTLFEMKNQSPEFWKNRTVYLFLFMLHRLTEYIRTGHIPFYWDDRDDLLKQDVKVHENVSNRLAKILKDIVRGIDKNPYIIAEKLLSTDECREVKENCKIPAALKSRPSFASVIAGEPISLDEIDGPAGANSSVLCQILDQLQQLNLGQRQMPGQILQAICNGRVSWQGGEHIVDLGHAECRNKQAQLESRIADLEDTVRLLKSQITSLTMLH